MLNNKININESIVIAYFFEYHEQDMDSCTIELKALEKNDLDNGTNY